VWSPGETLTIVSDRPLHSVPWAALTVPGTTHPALEHGPVIEATSVGAWIERREPRDRSSRALLAVGFDAAGREDEPQLREAEAEAREIAALWRPFGPVDLRIAERARWDRISSLELDRFATIHVSTHARIHQGLADRSTLRLEAGHGSEAVTVSAVADLALDADLVFLSFCDASRRIHAGSGLTDFARAFMAAGAEAVVAPSVPIDDAAARIVARGFYRRYLDGASRAIALRDALLALGRADTRWLHPYYWGFYRLIETGPVDRS
jgi:CHAT domain-containing protein